MANKITLSLNSACSCKRRRLSSSISDNTSSWSELFPDLLKLILSKLSYVQILRFQAVCSSWHRAVESYLSSSLYAPFSKTPWLMLPCQDYDPDDKNNDCDSRCFYSLEDQKEFTFKNMSKLFSYDDCCIGSSHGWLILLHRKDFRLFLFNPFSKAKIVLPHKPIKSCHLKAILLSDPSHGKDFEVALIEDEIFSSSIYFYKKGESTWNCFHGGANNCYSDIISSNDHLYALTSHNSIQVWDFHGSLPVKKREIHPSIPRKLVETINSCRGLYSSQNYLVESCGDLLLVMRFIGNFVNQEGQVVDESYLLSDEDTHPVICPYQTKMFLVYKLDSSEQNWVEVESLNNQALFVGINHSMSSGQDLSGCRRNTIHFTDDNWEQMHEDYLYGGHDCGMFNLEEKTVELCDRRNLGRIDPPPIWILPNPW